MISNDVCNCRGFFVPHIRGTNWNCIYRVSKTHEIESLEATGVAEYVEPSPSAWGKQEGGNHYKDLPIQPSEYIVRNGLGWFAGNVIKYVTRHASKGGVEDLRKARHYMDLLIEEWEKTHESQ